MQSNILEEINVRSIGVVREYFTFRELKLFSIARA